MGVVASALITELIGIHLIFGAFIVGAVMPKNAGLVRLNLEGEIPSIASCNNSAGQADASRRPLSVKIQGVVNGETLSGQIALSSTPTAAEFTSRREAQKEEQGSAH